MKTFESNEAFLGALREMIDRWCDERKLRPLARLLPGYLAFNGMNDGWGELHDALFSLRAFGPEAFNAVDWALIHDLIRAARSVIDRRQISI